MRASATRCCCPPESCAGYFFQPLQPEHPELFRGQRALFRPAPRADAAENVLLNGHVGKERVLLEEIADPALLRRQGDLLFRCRTAHGRPA